VEVKIRRAKSEDAERLCEIQVTAIQQLALSHYSTDQLRPWWNGLTSAPYRTYPERFYTIVAEVESTVVGFAALNTVKSSIRAVYVYPDYAGKGIGKKLLAELIQEARRQKLTELYCHASLNAQKFYEKAGLRLISGFTHKFSSGGEIECVIMKIDL
jgi:putative acetyltransferase